MKRFVVIAVVLVALTGLVAGCAGPSIGAADVGRLESIETTPVVFPAAETTACPELLACVERADAPVPVVRTGSPTSASGTSVSTSQEDRRQAALDARDATLEAVEASLPHCPHCGEPYHFLIYISSTISICPNCRQEVD